MEDLDAHFSPANLSLIESLQILAQELDKDLKPNMLISVNEEGYMERIPNYSEFLQIWIKEYNQRKEIYGKEDLLVWLKGKREDYLDTFMKARKDGRKEFFQKLLKVISTIIKELTGKKSLALDKDQLMALIKKDKLEELMEELEDLFEEESKYEDLSMELILHQGRLSELERLYAQNLMEEKDYLMEKAELRRALILILKEI